MTKDNNITVYVTPPVTKVQVQNNSMWIDWISDDSTMVRICNQDGGKIWLKLNDLEGAVVKIKEEIEKLD